MIVLLVDNEEWARIEPKTGSLHERLPPAICTDLPRNMLTDSGSKMAPFDDHVSALTSTQCDEVLCILICSLKRTIRLLVL